MNRILTWLEAGGSRRFLIACGIVASIVSLAIGGIVMGIILLLP